MDDNQPCLAKIKLKIPEQKWISDIFKKFPFVEIDLLKFLPYDFEKSIGNAEIEIVHDKIEHIIEGIKNHPSIIEFNVLEKEENRVKFNTIIDNPYLLYMVISCGILIDFPVKIRDGFAEWKLISTKKRIDSLLELLEKKGINFLLLQILKFHHSIHDDEEKFDLEESQVLKKAIHLGFFEIPRKISLADLANKLGRSKSTLSVMLRKIIKKKVLIEG